MDNGFQENVIAKVIVDKWTLPSFLFVCICMEKEWVICVDDTHINYGIGFLL